MLIPKEVTKALEGLDDTKKMMENMNTTLLHVLVALSEQNKHLAEIAKNTKKTAEHTARR